MTTQEINDLISLLALVGIAAMAALTAFNLIVYHLLHFWSSVAVFVFLVIRSLGIYWASAQGLTGITDIFDSTLARAIEFNLGAGLMGLDLFILSRHVRHEKRIGTEQLIASVPEMLASFRAESASDLVIDEQARATNQLALSNANANAEHSHTVREKEKS